MSNADVKPLPSWRDLAKQTAEEHDLNRALEPAQELIRALDKESRRRMEGVKAEEEGAA